MWGVMCDNTSNNAAMMKHLEKSKLKCLNGALARVFCILHVLNLVAKVGAVLWGLLVLCLIIS